MQRSIMLSPRARRHLRVALPLASAALALAAVLAFRSVPPASAAAEIRVTPTSGPPGTMVQITGSGWSPNVQVAIFLDNLQLNTTVTSAAGTLSTGFTFPSGATPGQKQIRAVGLAPAVGATATGNTGAAVGVGVSGGNGTGATVSTATPTPRANATAATTQVTAMAVFTVTAQASPTPTATPTPAPAAAATPTASPVATPSTSPAATPTPAGTPTPTPEPTPTPATAPAAGPPFALSVLRMDSPCIPLPGQAECEASRRALWQGERAAWQPIFAANGQPNPSDDDIKREVRNIRFAAGDPATVAAAAQALEWPHVRINAARYRGREASEADEWIEITNHGGGAQDMTGWSVRIAGSTVRWQFAEGFALQPGQSCKFYTGAPGADPCGGSSAVAQQGVMPNEQGVIQIWVDWLDLKVNEARYHSNPAQQPPPPNLQGYS